MIYQKLKRTWSYGTFERIPEFRRKFPELKNVSHEELCDRFSELGMDFYTKEKTKVNKYIRITLPFALILWVIMFILLPINYMIFGRWGYSLGEKNYILNWFKSLKLDL